MVRTLYLCLALATATMLHAQLRDLKIYWIDVEGGAATLIVTPSGQSLLVDAGFPGDRDPKRIQKTAKATGLTKIDILVTTHYHGDHVGGTPTLAQLIPIEKFYDHGESIEASTPQGAQLFEAYKATSQGKRVVLKPGDKIPLGGVEITVVSSNGEVIGRPINGGGPNDFCKDAQQKDPDKTENSRSVGFLLTYGKFKFLDLGDLTWDKEMMLACPTNKLGTVTLFQASHHGFSNGQSGSPAMVWALKPQVVVVNDGARKGFNADAYEIMTKIPGVEGIWQVHRAVQSDAAHNTSESMIANLDEGTGDQGLGIEVSVAKNGKFTMTNARNNFSHTYTTR
jgi:competence protein ComEC